MQRLLEIIHANTIPDNWTSINQQAFDELFGSQGGRYSVHAKATVKLRAPRMSSADGVSFAAYLHPSNPDSGAYGGMSFVIFPVEGAPCMLAMGIGTQGLSPDEAILSRPGHARKVGAITNWLNQKYATDNNLVAWSKQDPTRIDIDIPKNIKQQFQPYQAVFNRYGKVLYGFYVPSQDKTATNEALIAFLDLMFSERDVQPLTQHSQETSRIQDEYTRVILPSVTPGNVADLLKKRKYVILEGPPGTGKTHMALEILREEYNKNGFSIQFHPNTTYENFVGGLTPIQTSSDMGFSFKPTFGYLMAAVKEALLDPEKPFLLHIDEINRSDLAKVLGEAIFLFEPNDKQRVVRLPYKFEEPIGPKLELPPNLHILGTMNSSDRSISILDIAIRRRFAFVKLWPNYDVVQKYGCSLMVEAYRKLLDIFIEYANDETLNLMPGHAYFLENDSKLAIQTLQTSLYPLLEEYVSQGYVAGFVEEILAYMQWLKSLKA